MTSAPWVQWFVADSTSASGGAECRPSVSGQGCAASALASQNASGTVWPTKGACQASAVANLSFIPTTQTKQGYICTNKALGQCMATHTPHSTYQVYPTFEACRNSCSAATATVPSTCAGALAQAFQNRSFNPFGQEKPYSPPFESYDTPAMGNIQVPINPPDRVPVLGRLQMTPGLSGQGYNLYF